MSDLVLLASSSFPIPMALILETFASFHVSAYVLLPLAELISKDKKKLIFIIMFFCRAIFLIIMNFFYPEIVFFDILFIIIGHFIVLILSLIIRRDERLIKVAEKNLEILEGNLCPNCGNEVKNDEIICDVCGKKVRQ